MQRRRQNKFCCSVVVLQQNSAPGCHPLAQNHFVIVEHALCEHHHLPLACAVQQRVEYAATCRGGAREGARAAPGTKQHGRRHNNNRNTASHASRTYDSEPIALGRAVGHVQLARAPCGDAGGSSSSGRQMRLLSRRGRRAAPDCLARGDQDIQGRQTLAAAAAEVSDTRLKVWGLRAAHA